MHMLKYALVFSQNSFHHDFFFFAGVRGYPEAQVDMRVVAGNPQGYAGRGG